MNKNILIAILVVGVLAIGGYFLLNNQQPAVSDSNQDNNSDNNNVQILPNTHEVTYTSTGFSPSLLNIKKGDTVKFINQSTADMWVGSAMHPSHTVYGGTALQTHCPDAENDDFDQCENSGPGTSWSFTFNKVGEWGYHNHADARHFGKITVME